MHAPHDLPHEAVADPHRTAERPPARGRLLAPEEQRLVLELLQRGASPAIACHQLGLPLDAFRRTEDEDEAFRSRRQDVSAALAENVAAATYRAAIEGSVSAQTLWLRHSPPPEWRPDSSHENECGPYKNFSDQQLIEQAAAQGIGVPSELEAGTRREGR